MLGPHAADALVAVIVTSHDWSIFFLRSCLLSACSYFSLISLLVLMFKTELQVARVLLGYQVPTDCKRPTDVWTVELEGYS